MPPSSNSSDDAIISKNLDGIITSWNSGAERLFGYTAEEAIGKPMTILIPPDRINEEPGIIARIRRGERIEHYETVRRRKDGSPIDISLTVSPIKDSDGTIIGASKIARDITERKRAEKQQQLLVGEIKHRIKNLLATVQAIARQTLQNAPEEDRNAFIARLGAGRCAGPADDRTLGPRRRSRAGRARPAPIPASTTRASSPRDRRIFFSTRRRPRC